MIQCVGAALTQWFEHWDGAMTPWFPRCSRDEIGKFIIRLLWSWTSHFTSLCLSIDRWKTNEYYDCTYSAGLTCACCHKMGLNLCWVTKLLQPYLDTSDHEAELHMKFPFQLPPPPQITPCLLGGFLAALTHVKPACLEAAVSCLLTPSAAVAAAGRTDIQAADFL